ncbi:hypothetical protein H0H93_014862 [Arthromyces matolae]|nr:hypothetical protein H0H93_014862 [Arthromyces matolae]
MVNQRQQTRKKKKVSTAGRRRSARKPASPPSEVPATSNSPVMAPPKSRRPGTRQITIIGPRQPSEPEPTTPEITPPPEIDPEELQLSVAQTLVGMRIPRGDLEMYGMDLPLDQILDDLDSGGDSHEPDIVEVQRKRAHEQSPCMDEDEEASTVEDEEEEEEEEEELSPEESDEEEEEIFSVEFSVPYNGANETLEVQSDISWTEFISHLADIMSRSPKNVSVAYRFSTDTRTSPFKHLNKAMHLMELMCRAREAKEKLEKSRSQKPFIVELKSLDNVGGNNMKPSVSDNKGKKLKRKKASLIAKNESESDDENSGSDGDGARVEGKRVKSSGKKSGPQWVAQLEHDNACQEHPGSACVKLTTGHYPLSKSDLSTWAIFLQSGYPSTTQPPPKLKIGDAPKPSRTPNTSTALTPANMAGIQLQPPFAGGSTHAYPYGNPFPGFFPGYQVPQGFPYMPLPGPAYQTPTRYHGDFDMPSSDPPEEVEDVTLFPRITSWLEGLDNGVRGADGHHFSRFTEDLEREKFVRICDLADLSDVQELLGLCPGMAHGTGAKLLNYAKKDTNAIREKEQKRLRLKKHTPRRHL